MKIEEFFEKVNKAFDHCGMEDFQFEQMQEMKAKVDLTILAVTKTISTMHEELPPTARLVIYKRALDSLSLNLMREACNHIIQQEFDKNKPNESTITQ